MVKRVASRGRNAGGTFWGCKNFPDCRGTADIDVPGNIDAPAIRRKVELIDGTVDRPGWIAGYASGGGRLRSVELDSELRKLLSTYWLAREDVDSARPADAATLRTLGVVRKILQRGALPPIHPDSERQLLQDLGLGNDVEESRLPGDRSVSLRPAPLLSRDSLVGHFATGPEASSDLALGSTDEELFLEWVQEHLGIQAAQWFTPQARLDRLAEASGKEVRGEIAVDFLATPPWLAPLIVEIDGPQHEDAAAVDATADDLAISLGIRVIRITTREVRSRTGRGLEALNEWWAPPPPVADDRELALLLIPTQLHRVALAIVESLEAGFLAGDSWSISLRDSVGGVGGRLGPYLDLIAAVDDLWGGSSLSPNVVTIEDKEGGWTYELHDGRYVQVPFEARKADVKIRAETNRLPTAPLPSRRSSVPRVVIRSAIVNVDILSGRGDGVNDHVPLSGVTWTGANSTLV